MKKIIFALILLGSAFSTQAAVTGSVDLQYAIPKFEEDEDFDSVSGKGFRLGGELNFSQNFYGNLEYQNNKYSNDEEQKTSEFRLGGGYRYALPQGTAGIPITLHGGLFGESNKYELDAPADSFTAEIDGTGVGLNVGADFKFTPKFTLGVGISYSKLKGDFSFLFTDDGTTGSTDVDHNIFNTELTGLYNITPMVGILGSYRMRNDKISVDLINEDIKQKTNEFRLGVRLNFGGAGFSGAQKAGK